MRILFLLLFPVFLSAQINNAYGVIEIGSFPTSSSTGPKFAYRPADSSFYRWVSGSTWVKIIPDEPDTLYLKQLSGTTALVDGDTIDISTYFLKSDTTSAFASYLKRPVGWGLSLLTGKYPFVDSSKVASRYYVSTSPTTIANNYIATSNGTNLVARNLFDNNTYVGILNSKPVIFGSQSVAGLPVGVDGYWLDVSNYKWPARYNSTAGAWIYPVQSSLTGGLGTATRALFNDADGRATDNQYFTYNASTNTLNTGNSDIKISATNVNPTTSILIGSGTVGSQSVNIKGMSAGNGGTAIGQGATAGQSATALGSSVTAGAFSFGMGLDVQVSGTAAVGIGNAIRVSHTGSIAIGRASTTTATGQFVVGAGGSNSSTITDVYFGSGVQRGNPYDATGAAGASYTINGSGALGSNFAGGNLTLAGGKPTGSGLSGDVIFSTATTGATGTTLRSLTNRWWVKGETGRLGNTSSPSEDLHVVGDGYFTDSLRLNTTPSHSAITGILTRDATGWIGLASLSNLTYSGGVLTAQNFANTNLTATGNRIHDWANYNFTWSNMKKFMWGADSLFKITKEFSGYTIATLRSPNGQALMDLQGNDDIGGNSAEIRLTDTETGNIFFLINDDRGFGSDGFRLEHFNTTNYHNSLFIDKTSRLFHINQSEKSSGTMYQGDASINTGLTKTIVRGTSSTTNTDSIMAVHYFRTTNNRIKNKDIFGVYSANGAVDTMYFRLDKVGGLHQYKKAFFHGLGTGTASTILGKTSTNEIVPVSLSSFGNGIYSSSATLANHTTRARVPDDGNLFFSQTYNGGADSSFFYFANATSGERYVGLGMTDTASTGGASLLIGNDGAGEMSFELQTIDAVNGNTQIRGVNGDLNLSSSAGNISLSTNVANEVRVTGLIRSKQEAYYEITSTSSPQTFSNDYSDNFVNQGGTQASFTFLFPASPEDGQILSMTWNNAISVLTLDGNGNTITGTAVTTAVAGTRRQFKYYASASAWIKIY